MNAILEIEPQSAVSILTDAFRADPAARWMYPEAGRYETFFPRFIRAFGGEAFARETALFADGVAALWLPPGAGPDERALFALIQESVPAKRQDEVFALFEQLGQHHPTEPHWYLPMIGVEPGRQSRGLGGALMRQALERCERDGLPAYLESTNPRNIPFYERHGFKPVGDIRVADCPSIVPMWRS